jgi:molecular chaperone DnaK
VAELETAMKGEDKAHIESRIARLEEVAKALQAAAAAGSGGDAGAGPQAGASGADSPSPEDVVDAEFTEVKDDDAKQ